MYALSHGTTSHFTRNIVRCARVSSDRREKGKVEIPTTG